MARYIDAEALMDDLLLYAEANEGTYHAEGFKNAITVVEDQPTADVVEVVRCKDCKHLEIINGPHIYARCNLHEFPIISFGVIDTREWFCADGEKREK